MLVTLRLKVRFDFLSFFYILTAKHLALLQLLSLAPTRSLVNQSMSTDLYFWSLTPVLMLALTLLFVLTLLHPFMLALSYLFSRANSLPLVLSCRAPSLMPSYFSMSLGIETINCGTTTSARHVTCIFAHCPPAGPQKVSRLCSQCWRLRCILFALGLYLLCTYRNLHHRSETYSLLIALSRPPAGLEKIRGFAANAGGFGAFCLPLGLYNSSLGTLSAI
ncbi:uncharacterized protein F5891DRAFT_225737 [Suillus fuscotomentosus]|uniref:Uncharacterized protein n=1 Tax=Suillus fuscotomentosus TaxID=1912939 RepID=A0AAD4HV88_9AGAM|nr:uncharacterized protein F5891DRAFT_225737 [Suillus fuscotomentosus]KAG1908069.1 hypothetical protein F5891DRAFT_225737 [Suillus fuscotomentosus]